MQTLQLQPLTYQWVLCSIAALLSKDSEAFNGDALALLQAARKNLSAVFVMVSLIAQRALLQICNCSVDLIRAWTEPKALQRQVIMPGRFEA